MSPSRPRIRSPARVASFFQDQSNTIFGVVNMFTGGALSRLSIFAMGVMPYISASIIIQMMSMVIPTLMELRKEGESGRRKITEYTRYATVVLAAFQSFAAAGALVKGGLTLVTGWQFLFTATVTMTTGMSMTGKMSTIIRVTDSAPISTISIAAIADV